MAQGRQRDEWDRFALLIATLRNLQRGKGTRPTAVADVHPFMRARKQSAAGVIAKLQGWANPKFTGWPEKPPEKE
jgi:hypothetical protein